METQDFERFEFKYFVPQARTEPIRRFLAPFLVRDPFASEAGAYQSTNLYLDSPGLYFYWTHVRSELNRFKLRVRYYGDGPRCYFEIKRKIRDVVIKKRSSIPRADWDAVWDGDRRAIDSSSNPAHLDEFLGLALLHRAEPRFLIRYQREAFENVFEEDARITFDRALCYQPANGYDLQGEDRGWTFIDGASTFAGLHAGALLELKFDRFYPSWLRELVVKFDLVRIQFSKYLTTVDEHGARRVDGLQSLLQSPLIESPWRTLLRPGVRRLIAGPRLEE